MTGLVWRDTLTLTPGQWAMLLNVTTLALYWQGRRATWQQDCALLAMLCAGLRVTFAGAQLGIDVRTTYAALPPLQGLTGQGFLSELAFANYLKLQPPLYAWLLCRLPHYGAQQTLALLPGIIVWGGFYQTQGRTAAWSIAATPLFQLMTVQPSNDWWVCGWLCLGMMAANAGRRGVGAGCVMMACAVKYTAYCVLPVFVISLRFWILPVMAFICGYWVWALQTDLLWATQQADHYLRQFTLGVWPRPATQALSRAAGTLRWRWLHLGGRCAQASAWYLFPLYLLRQTLWCYLIFIGLVVGYGNVKYLTLLFPVMLMEAKTCEEYGVKG